MQLTQAHSLIKFSINMKTLAVLLLAVAAAATYSVKIDWAQVKPVTLMDACWDGSDSKMNSSADLYSNSRIFNRETSGSNQFPYQVSWLKSEIF